MQFIVIVSTWLATYADLDTLSPVVLDGVRLPSIFGHGQPGGHF